MSRTPADVEAELKRIGHHAEARSTSSSSTPRRASATASPTTCRRAAAWAARRRSISPRAACKITGTDAWSWDAPFVYTAKKYAETKNAKLIWEGHKSGREIGYCHIEKLHNLEALASHRVHGRVLPGQDQSRVRRLDPRRRHHRGMSDEACHIRCRRQSARGAGGVLRSRI